MNLTFSFQGATILCTESFAFFEKNREYYCTHDTGEHFYVWCPHERFGVNEIKLSKEHKRHFRRA